MDSSAAEGASLLDTNKYGVCYHRRCQNITNLLLLKPCDTLVCVLGCVAQMQEVSYWKLPSVSAMGVVFAARFSSTLWRYVPAIELEETVRSSCSAGCPIRLNVSRMEGRDLCKHIRIAVFSSSSPVFLHFLKGSLDSAPVERQWQTALVKSVIHFRFALQLKLQFSVREKKKKKKHFWNISE